MSTLLVIHSTLNVHKKNTKEDLLRRKEIFTAMNKLKMFEQLFTENGIDMILIDNNMIELDEEYRNSLPKMCKIITYKNNKNGSINKGVGLIENWIHLKEIIRSYEWIIHFESRLLLTSVIFFKQFIEKKQAYFKQGSNYNSNKDVFTGLFSIRSENLVNYINTINVNKLLKNKICIEKSLYDYLAKQHIPFTYLKRLDLLRYHTDNGEYKEQQI